MIKVATYNSLAGLWIFLALLAIAVSPKAYSEVQDLGPTGSQPSVIDSGGKTVDLYQGSYALLISESNYRGGAKKGWTVLDHQSAEVDALSSVLRQQGFHVTRVKDATSSELRDLLRKFMLTVGDQPNNRIVVVFSGHGYTNADSLGYVVPIDAPAPAFDPTEFQIKAIPMQDITDLAREAHAKHMLFLFDSCFSGSIFMTKSKPDRPDFSHMTPGQRTTFFLGTAQLPVRQFITAGLAGEKVPAISIFLPAVTQALSGAIPISRDGYITGKELGEWIEDNLPAYNDSTHPHSDTINDLNLKYGDIVFAIPRGGTFATPTGNAVPASTSVPTLNGNAAVPQSTSGATPPSNAAAPASTPEEVPPVNVREPQSSPGQSSTTSAPPATHSDQSALVTLSPLGSALFPAYRSPVVPTPVRLLPVREGQYESQITAGNDFDLSGAYDVRYWRTGEVLNVEIEGDVWLNGTDVEAQHICALKLSLEADGNDLATASKLKVDINVDSKSHHRLGPYTFQIPIRRDYSEKLTYFRLEHLLASKILGFDQCGHYYIPMTSDGDSIILQ